MLGPVDEELRALERAAATGDRDAYLRLAVARRRSGWRPPADITLRWPFPVRLPFPRIEGEVRVPQDVLFLEDRVVLQVGNHELELPWLSWVRTPEEVQIDAWNGDPLAEAEPAVRCGAGLRQLVRSPSRETPGGGATYLLSAGGARGALVLPWAICGGFRHEDLQVGAPGDWADDPALAGAGPWAAGRPGWTLVLHGEAVAACRGLREMLGLALPQVAALKPRLGGPMFVGFREDLQRAAARFRAAGVEAEAVWFDALPDGLEPLPEAP